MQEQGQNEKTRLVEISDPEAKNLDQAFQKMWEVAGCTSCTKPLHHISINPMQDERLTDKQLLAIIARCEQKYGYRMFQHQRVIVEHVKDGRQHFHVIWNRVSLTTGRAVWPGHHWLKSKEVCREMERELGLQSPTPRQHRKPRAQTGGRTRQRPKATTGRPGRSKTPVTSPPRSMTGNPIRFTGDSIGLSGKTHTTSAKPPAIPKQPMPRIRTAKAENINPPPIRPSRPQAQAQGWPMEAVLDWKTWGKKDPRAFFRKWPELAR